MDNILLIIVLIVLGCFTLHGYIRGMVRMVFSLVAIVLTVVLASLAAPYTAEFLRTQTPLYDTIQEKCAEAVQSVIEKNMEEKLPEQEELPGQQETPEHSQEAEPEKLQLFGMELPPEVQELFTGNLAEQARALMEDSGLFEEAANQIADAVLLRLSWTLSFLIISILLGVLIHLLDIIAKLPGINSINHVGGLIVGALEGLVIVWILFFVITLCQGSHWGSGMMKEIQENPLLKLLYENNVIEQIF